MACFGLRDLLFEFFFFYDFSVIGDFDFAGDLVLAGDLALLAGDFFYSSASFVSVSVYLVSLA